MKNSNPMINAAIIAATLTPYSLPQDPEFMRQHNPELSRRKVMKKRNRPQKPNSNRAKAKAARQARKKTRKAK